DKLRKTSLYNRLTITVSALFIIAYFSSLFITHKIYLHFVEQQYDERVFTIARNLASVCYQPILNHNEVEIYQSARTFLQEEDVEYVLILNRQDEVLASDFGNNVPGDSAVHNIIDKIRPHLKGFPYVIKDNVTDEIIIHPVKMEKYEMPWGYVVIGFNKSGVRDLLRKAGYTALFISTIVLFLGLVLLQQFSQKLTRPIRDLMDGTDEVSQGNFEYQIHTDDEGELGQLTRKFNEMTLKLNYYYKQKSLLNKKLHEYNEKLEEKIRERTKQLKDIQEEVLLIFHQIPVGLLVVDLEGGIMWYNRELMHIVELPEDENISHKKFSSLPQFDGIGLSLVLEKLDAMGEKQVIRHNLDFSEAHQNKIVEIASQPLQREEASREGTIFIIKDITAEVTLERKMAQDQRLDSIGTIAGGIAHDFNNILAIILPNAQLLKMKIKDNDEWIKYLDTIEKAADQASSLTRKILSFSRGSSREDFEIINLGILVEDFINMFRRVLDRKIEINNELDSELWNIKADVNQLEQVLMNLAVNSRDAMPSGGTLTFRAKNILVRNGDGTPENPHLDPGKYVCLEIEDTGNGIPREYMDKIFDPFFSSKTEGKGTGLGLSVVYGIVRGHKGIIDVKSIMGKGTTFLIYFPVSEEKVFVSHIDDKSPEPGSGSLLIVDDELMIRETLCGMLESLSYKVFTAQNGKEAVDIYREHQDEIDVILMDIQMPVLDGVGAASQIHEIDKDVSIIFTSGYAD
ncbi:MAG: ATP-binding protein, partial [Calditrichia bacterium]